MVIYSQGIEEFCIVKLGQILEKRFERLKDEVKYFSGIKVNVIYYICIYVERRRKNSLEDEMEVKWSELKIEIWSQRGFCIWKFLEIKFLGESFFIV